MSLRDARVREQLLARLDKLRPGMRPAWGKFTTCNILAHVNEGMRMGTGELAVKFRWTPIALPGLKWLVLNVIPLPKGAPTAPELLREVDEDEGVFLQEVDTLRTFVCTFVNRHDVDPRHPLFGRMSRKAWDRLAAKHIDHHFRQFGV